MRRQASGTGTHGLGAAHRLEMQGMRPRMAAVLLCVAGLAPATGAQAGILDTESCRRNKAEHDTLGGSGLREMMAKGPEWGKANLTRERVEQIRRFLALEEDIRFRCPLGKARPELEAAESEAGSTTALQPNEQEPAAKALPAAKPARKTKPPAREGSGDAAGVQTSGGSAEAKAPPAAKPAAKKKPSATDAGAAQAE